MRLCDRLHQRKPQAGTALLAGAGIVHTEEGLKDPAAEVRRNAGALVGDVQPEAAVCQMAGDADRAAGGALLHSVLQQI